MKIEKIIQETINEYLDDLQLEYLYHATPSCYVNSIKKFGLGGQIPKKRFWDYKNTPYANIKQGVFLATDEYVAESYLDSSDEFYELAEWYEEKYGKELNIVVFKVKINDLDKSLLSIDENQMVDDNGDDNHTYFYNGVIPFNKLKIVQI